MTTRRQPGESCNYYRDAAGFCHLQNRCWSGKPCPKTQADADQARSQLVDQVIAQRDK
jgi:hypothetical protein